MSRQPPGVRASPRTIALVRTTAREAAATAGTRVARPPVRVVNTGRGRAAHRGGPERGGPGRSGSRAPGGTAHGAGGGRQRGVLPRGRGEPGQRRLERQLLRPACVHAAEQRIDQPVHEFLAEPRGHVAGDGHVAVARGRGQRGVGPGAGQPGSGEDPRAGQRVQVGGHPHQLPPRQRPQPLPGPYPGRRRSGQRQLAGQADRTDEVSALRAAGEQRLGACVDRDPGHLGDRELAAEPWRSLQEGHRQAGVTQEERGSEPGDAAAHDDDAGQLSTGGHAASLSVPPRGERGGCA